MTFSLFQTLKTAFLKLKIRILSFFCGFLVFLHYFCDLKRENRPNKLLLNFKRKIYER